MNTTHVNVIFLDPKHNYVTRVNEDQTDEQIQSYFVGTRFAGLGTCINVEITRNNTTPELKVSDDLAVITGMEEQTVALYNDLMRMTAQREDLPNGIPSHSANYIAQRLYHYGWRKPL